MNNVQKTITAIHKMDSNELNQIVEAIKLKRTWLAKTTARSLTVGDTVEFTGRHGHTERGRVAKINPKTVIVNAGPGQRWRVDASLLKVVDTLA